MEDENESQVVVHAYSDDLNLSFNALSREAPRVGEEFIVSLSKRPALGEKVAEL